MEILPSFDDIMRDISRGIDPMTGKKYKEEKSEEEQKIEDLKEELKKERRRNSIPPDFGT